MVPAASADKAAPAEAGLAEAAEAVVVARQLRLQADQLAEHLRTRQGQVDHREAELNARSAQFENESRTARLLLTEREGEVGERLAAIKAHEQEVEHRIARLASAEAAAEAKQRDAERHLAQREEQLAALADRMEKEAAAQRAAKEEWLTQQQRGENELRAERQRIDFRREASLELVRQLLAGVERRRLSVEAQAERTASRETVDRTSLALEEELVQKLQSLEVRQQRIDKAESELAQARAEIERLREESARQRDKDRESARSDRQRMAMEQRRALAELDEKRQSLERRGEQIDQNWAALEQLRSELGRMHRETLEIRLATEELWVQLAGTAPPAAITHSLGQIRSRLADDYRLAGADLAEKKQQLHSLYEQLAEQHEKLRRHKEEFDGWIAARQDEIQQQAQRLVAREQQLERQEMQFNDAARRWEAERLDYQQEVRRLRMRLAAAEAVGATV